MRLRIRKIKFDVFMLLLSLFWFVGMIGNVFFINESSKLTKENIVELVVTLDSITISDEEKNLYAEIYAKEYENSFLIPTYICRNLSLNCLRDLSEGDTLVLSIRKETEKMINQVEFIDIVSLRTDLQIIFDLEDYNAYTNEASQPAKITGFVVALISLSSFLYFLHKIMRKNKKKSGVQY